MSSRFGTRVMNLSSWRSGEKRGWMVYSSGSQGFLVETDEVEYIAVGKYNL